MLEVVPFTYDEVLTDLTGRLVDKGYDADVDGSNAAMLASVLSHTVAMLNTNIAFNTSEMLLSSATKDINILNIARQMGYEAQNKVSYCYTITLQAKIDTSRDELSVYTKLYELPKYGSFTSGSNTYYYMGETIRRYISNKNITEGADNSYFEILVKEGDLKTAEDNPDILEITTTYLDANNEIQTQNYIDIPFTNVEDYGIDLYLTYIDAYGIEHIDELWTKTTQFLIDKDTNLTKQFMRLEDLSTRTPKCYFNLAGIGNELRLNTVIKANVLISKGSLGVAEGTMTVPSPLSDTFAIYDGEDTDKNQRLTVSGQDEESTTSIKLNAPLFHNSANRAVTKYDYIAICERQSIVDQTQVWGGDEEDPIRLGHIFFSVTPSYYLRNFTIDELKNNFVLSNISTPSAFFVKDTELRSTTYNEFGELTNLGVFDILDEFKIMTMQLHHRHPIYVNFDYTISVVRYNLKRTKQEINQDVFDIISNYFDNYIELFESQYFNSNVIKRVDTETTDLTGVNITLINSISLYTNNINSERENAGEKQITIFLASPFESYFDSEGVFRTGYLPDIYTENFLATTNSILRVDWENPSEVPTIDMDEFSFDIYYNDFLCGKYKVINKVRKHIRIDLYIRDDGAEDILYASSPLTPALFEVERRLTLKYKNSDFRLFKNTLPRLSSVVFE